MLIVGKTMCMRFTIETQPFKRMLNMLNQAWPPHGRQHPPVRLEASGGRLRVQKGQLAAEIDAVIWQDGCCAVSGTSLLHAINDSRHRPILHVEVDEDQLWVGEFPLPCIHDSAPAATCAASRIFFASQLGLVASRPVSEWSQVA